MQCKDVQLVMEIGKEPISSLCFKSGNEDIIYASSGMEVQCFDVHMATSWKPLQSYSYNKEEINQDALRTFLLRKLDNLAKDDKCQITMISTWATELYLDKINRLLLEDDTAMVNHGSEYQ
ncbi:uncharacterized protein LOC112024964 [Quercus suber]|uniref:uncharacterized protein LOC112024964 n=1 Tax=Quercus suber TaxID=58331 RepID=UPI000CE17FD8|nr:uncharacterized protein LOC112024964 [Quercus suber]